MCLPVRAPPAGCLDRVDSMFASFGAARSGGSVGAGFRVRYVLKASVAIASNEAFSGWTKTFTDPRLCAAIVGRITFGGNIIETRAS
jgi:hypothetical protein